MKDMVDNANDDAKNFQHRRRFVSNGEHRRIRIKLNTTPFTDRDMTLVNLLRWQGVKSAEARKKNAAKRKADGISAAPPQQVSNSDTSRPGRRSGHARYLAATSRFNVKELVSFMVQWSRGACMVQWSSLKRRGHVSSLAATTGLDVKEYADRMVRRGHARYLAATSGLYVMEFASRMVQIGSL
jgi:hypothetical protein